MKNPVARLKALLGELLQNGRVTTENTAALQAQTAALQAQTAALQAQIAALQAALAALQTPIAALQAQTAALLPPIAALQTPIAALQTPIAALQCQFTRLESSIVDTASGIASLTHAFAAKPWPDLFDPFATDKIARRISRLGGMLTPGTVEGHRKIRVGHQYDGGYVMIDDWQGVRGAISIGIGDNDAWDLEMSSRDIPVAQFDHTIVAAPTAGSGMAWHCVGIGPDDTERLRTLRSIVRLADFPDEGDLLLKLDAEAAEWESLQSEAVAPLGRFRQMIIEFHWFDRIADDAWFDVACRTIERIRRSHAPVHVHANNGVSMLLLGGISFPRVLEVTFVRKDCYVLTASDELFPTALDSPCHHGRPDHFLGRFQFPAP